MLRPRRHRVRYVWQPCTAPRYRQRLEQSVSGDAVVERLDACTPGGRMRTFLRVTVFVNGFGRLRFWFRQELRHERR